MHSLNKAQKVNSYKGHVHPTSCFISNNEHILLKSGTGEVEADYAEYCQVIFLPVHISTTQFIIHTKLSSPKQISYQNTVHDKAYN
jgi:hypothetical protein